MIFNSLENFADSVRFEILICLDGLIDCLDPDCCSSSRCQSTEECISRTSAKDMYK